MHTLAVTVEIETVSLISTFGSLPEQMKKKAQQKCLVPDCYYTCMHSKKCVPRHPLPRPGILDMQIRATETNRPKNRSLMVEPLL